MLAIYLSATLMATLFLLHCAVVGGAVLSVARVEGLERRLRVFFSLCLGMLVNMTVLFALGLAGELHLPAIAIVALALLAGGGMVVARSSRHVFESRKNHTGKIKGSSGSIASEIVMTLEAKRFAVLEIATLVVIFQLCIAVSLHPPGHWDDTMYQLPLARHYVEHQGIVLHEYVRFPLFPQNMNLLFALGLMLGDMLAGASLDATAGTELTATWHFGAPEVYAQVFATLPLFVLALGLWGASQRYIGSGIPGLLAGLTLFMIGPIKSTLGFAYVDNGLAMYCFAAALAVALLAGKAPVANRAWPFFAGLLAGAACGIKYFGVVFATGLGFVLFVVVVLMHRRASSADGAALSILRTGTLYGLGVILAGAGWYVRSYLISGDPAHPAGAPIFGFFLWNEGDLAAQYAEQGEHGTGASPVMWPNALLEAGVALWLPAFAGLFLRRVAMPIRVLQAVFLGYLFFWLFVSQVPRYLGPVYGLGGFLAFHALYRAVQWVAPYVRKSKAETAAGKPRVWPAALVLLITLTYSADRGVKYGKEYLNAEAVLQTNPGYTLYKAANAHISEYGPRLVQVGFENGVYFFRGTVIGDWFGPGRYRDILECERLPCAMPAVAGLENTLRKHGARMVLMNREQVFNLDEATLQKAGWELLSSSEHGVLLAAPEKDTPPN